MDDFGINEMQNMQKRLQDTYKDKWEPISPETGKSKLLRLVGEVGEVIDIVKKNNACELLPDNKQRKELIEELADVIMYYNDVLLCYGISADELKRAYPEKFDRNMASW